MPQAAKCCAPLPSTPAAIKISTYVDAKDLLPGGARVGKGIGPAAASAIQAARARMGALDWWVWLPHAY
jgi:hypothetical protein